MHQSPSATVLVSFMPAVLIEVFSFLTCEETGLTRVHGWFESEDNGDFAMVVDTDDLYIMA